MKVKILNEEHYTAIEKIYYDVVQSISKKQILKTGIDPKNDLTDKITELWFGALKKWYLNSNDVDHILMGLFDNDKLIAYVGIRFDLPAGYENDWVVSYLKADPNTNIISNNGLKKLWVEMFSYAEGRGKTRWHTITELKRHKAFDSFGIRIVPEINNRYEFFTLCEVPRGTKSDIDWVFSMMGRIIHHDKDYIVRTGILKRLI